MGVIDAIILGLVQGITEFLPISSTGHLVLAREWLTISDTNALAFDAVLHFATTAAVVLYFWNDLWGLMQVLFRKLGRLPVNQKDITLLYALVLGTIPAVVVGLFLESIISEHLRTIGIIAGILFLASLLFMYAEWRYYLRPNHGELTLRTGLLIGFFQVLALLPGMSRSGVTLAGGMLLGLSRYEAARFSFLLAIPITAGVGAKMLIELLATPGEVAWGMVALGSAISFCTALFVIHFFLRFIRRYTLWPFAWYGIILSGLVGYVSFFTLA
jgi:undecaprenyl-diphosphatase